MYTSDKLLRQKFIVASLAARQLCLYRGLIKDPVFQSFLTLVDQMISDNESHQVLTESYFNLTSLLTEIEVPKHFRGDTWQYHLITLLIRDDNYFTRTAETVSLKDMKNSLKQMATFDLRNLQSLTGIESRNFRSFLKQKFSDRDPSHIKLDQWPGWEQDHPEITDYPEQAEEISNPPAELILANSLLVIKDWGEFLPNLAAHYSQNGAGLFGQYMAFRWSSTGTEGHLEGIGDPDPVTFDNLFGYHNERKIVIENTEKLLKGLPANNILLYGERGTGKSSAVKALIHKFGPAGLRLVEVPKQYLSTFPQIIQLLKNRAQKFIIFVDDLSFEENETEYKYLKAVLEGSLESRPQNILVYATSNRRHLIKERFSDREHVNVHDEVRIRDSMQEKLSLADRFGITVTFTSPAQAQYLNIVENLTRQAGISISKDELDTLALQWEMRYNGRSGRTAKQFVDWLSGEKQLKRF